MLLVLVSLSVCVSIKNANGQQCQLHSFIVGGTSGTASVAGTAFKVVVVVDRRTRTMHTLYTPGPEVQLMIEEAPFVDVIVALFFTNQRYLPIETQSGKGAAKRRRQHRPLNGIDLILLLLHLYEERLARQRRTHRQTTKKPLHRGNWNIVPLPPPSLPPYWAINSGFLAAESHVE